MNKLVPLLILGCAVFCVAQGWASYEFHSRDYRQILRVFMRKSPNDPDYTRTEAQNVCKQRKGSLITKKKIVKKFGRFLYYYWRARKPRYTTTIEYLLSGLLGSDPKNPAKKMMKLAERKYRFQRYRLSDKNLTARVAFLCIQKL